MRPDQDQEVSLSIDTGKSLTTTSAYTRAKRSMVHKPMMRRSRDPVYRFLLKSVQLYPERWATAATRRELFEECASLLGQHSQYADLTATSVREIMLAFVRRHCKRAGPSASLQYLADTGLGAVNPEYLHRYGLVPMGGLKAAQSPAESVPGETQPTPPGRPCGINETTAKLARFRMYRPPPPLSSPRERSPLRSATSGSAVDLDGSGACHDDVPASSRSLESPLGSVSESRDKEAHADNSGSNTPAQSDTPSSNTSTNGPVVAVDIETPDAVECDLAAVRRRALKGGALLDEIWKSGCGFAVFHNPRDRILQACMLELLSPEVLASEADFAFGYNKLSTFLHQRLKQKRSCRPPSVEQSTQCK